MTLNRNPNQPPRDKPTEPWRVERMVQHVPGHLGEESRLSPWLFVAAIAVVVIVGVLLLLLTQIPSTPPVSSGTQATIAPTKHVTIIRITATPEPTQTATLVPTPVVVKYTVKQGDTLSTIAKQFKVSVEAIRAANNLTNDTLHPGDVLSIPQGTPTPGAIAQVTGASDTPGPTAPPTNTPPLFQTPTLIPQPTAANTLATTPTPTPGVVIYKVRSGDTLIAIATIYSTTVQSIMTMSKITSINLQVGQTLTVPVGIWPSTPVPPTAYYSPTPTLTPQFSYAAPELLMPIDGADFSHDTGVTLQWLSLGIKSDEYYVVHVRYVAKGMEVDLPGYTVNYDQGTSLTLNSSPAGDNGPAQFWWYVVVVRNNGCSPGGGTTGQPCAVSPVSDTASFTWR